MIGRKNLHVTAERANFPLGALNVRAGSAANVALFDVPVRAGVSVTAVWMRVVNCDGESADYAAVQTGTLWVVDVPASHFATPGEVPNGVEVWASGTGADGEPYTWSIGVGDLCVLDGDSGEPVPGVAWTAIKLRETVPDNPVYGDAKIAGGALYVWDGTTWVGGGGGGGGGIVDDAVTRTSSNAVKSSGIWSAIWGTLTALPTGFSALYDWCVAQLGGKADKSEMSITTANDTATITLKQGTSATVLTQHQPLPAAVAPSTSAVQGAYADARDTGAALAGKQSSITASGILNGNGSGGVTAAVAGTDYQAALSQTQLNNIAAVPSKLDSSVTDAYSIAVASGHLTVTDSQSNATYVFAGPVSNPDGVARGEDLPYATGVSMDESEGVYFPIDRAVNSYEATDGDTTLTLNMPQPMAVDQGGRARDFVLDVDNSANSGALGIEFELLGEDYALAVTDGDDLAEITELAAGERARFYFTETTQQFTPTGAQAPIPVISVQRMTIEIITTQGGA